MKIEIREFKYKKFLLFIAETAQEKTALDIIGNGKIYDEPKTVTAKLRTDDWFNLYDEPKTVTAKLRTDDWFNPYLSFELKK